MTGRYDGAHMSVFGYILPRTKRLSRLTDLDKICLYRLGMVEFYFRNSKKGRLTAKTFNVSTATVYRWVKRYRKWNLSSLKDYSRRPIHTRLPTTNWKLIQKVIDIRKENPHFSKYKIGFVMRAEGLNISDSTVGRILKRKNLIPLKPRGNTRRRSILSWPKAEKWLWLKNPGSLIQIDTAYLNPRGRRYCYQFVAVDSTTRMVFSKIYPTRGSKNGKLFLEEVKRHFPFMIQSVQSDNGSEFLGEFHSKLQEENIKHFFTYPATPKMNSRAERVIKTVREEFWNDGNLLGDLHDLNESLEEWLTFYNTKRPHQSLNYQTPMGYYLSLKEKETIGFR